MSQQHVPGMISRRAVLRTIPVLGAVALLNACGGTGNTPTSAPGSTNVSPTTASGVTATPSAAAAATSSPASGASVQTASTQTANRTPSGELRVAVGFDFPTAMDALKTTHLSPYGMLETLTFQTPDNKIVPWLAASVTNVNPTTWRVGLRPNAKFWDGSPVTATDAINAIKKAWEVYPDSKGLIDPNTTLTAVDATTVEFAIPKPIGGFPGILSQTSFGIFKSSSTTESNGALMTGPYKPTSFLSNQELDLEPFMDHWAGPPPIAKISVRYVEDPNARALALQSGEVDFLYNIPPQVLSTFSSDIQSAITPSGRVDMVSLNTKRPPFSEAAVRSAMAFGIDRAALNQVGLDGKGVPATTLFQQSLGYAVIPVQSTDVDQAKKLLDDAGWTMGSDGVRAKNGQRLAFTLYSYPGRAELTPIAVTMKSELQPLGFDIKVEEVQTVATVTKTGKWDAAMKSNSTIPTGDPLYEFNRLLLTDGGDNVGEYSNPQVDQLIGQMTPVLDEKQRQDLSLQIQQIFKNDVPDILLVVEPVVTAYKKGKVKGYVPHPNDSYMITTAISVD